MEIFTMRETTPPAGLNTQVALNLLEFKLKSGRSWSEQFSVGDCDLRKCQLNYAVF